MKKFFNYLLIFLIWSNISFSEIYSCSADLTRFGREGEIENKIYIRDGNYFYNNHDWKFDIYYESKEEIHLIDGTTKSMFIVILNKKTNEFTEGYLSIDDSREYEQVSNTYGKCVVKK